MKHPYSNHDETFFSDFPVTTTDLIPCYPCGAKIERSRANWYIGDCPIGGEHGKEIYPRCDACEWKAQAASRRRFARQALCGPFVFLVLLQLLGGLETDPFGTIRTVMPWICLFCFGAAAKAIACARNFERKATLYVRK